VFARDGENVALTTTAAEIVFRSLPMSLWNGSQAAYSIIMVWPRS